MMQSGLGPGRTRQRSQADGSEPGGMEGRLANSSFPLYAASRGLRVTLPTRLGRCQLGIHAISPSRANFLSESESRIVITAKERRQCSRAAWCGNSRAQDRSKPGRTESFAVVCPPSASTAAPHSFQFPNSKRLARTLDRRRMTGRRNHTTPPKGS